MSKTPALQGWDVIVSHLLIKRLLAAMAIALSLGTTHSAAAASYTILDLGVVETTSSQGFISYGFQGYGNLNASGQVAGFGFTPGPENRFAFRTGANTPITSASKLGTMGGMESAAYAINASGQTVGVAYNANPAAGGQAFRTTATGLVSDPGTNLGTLSGAASVAFGINDSGQTVGYSSLGNNIQHAFRTAPNATINPSTDDLGTFSGSGSSIAYSINSAGQIVGQSSIASGATHAFRIVPNGKISDADADLGTFGGNFSSAYGINASGQTVGTSSIDQANSIQHAFRTTPTGKISDPGTDLGSLGGTTSTALAINTLGQAVGSASLSNPTSFPHAFFVDVNGPMQDLNSLIPTGSGWTLMSANGINDSGQIAGYGSRSGQFHAFLLTPVPEPGVVALLAIVFPLFLAGRTRRGPMPSTARPL